MDLAESRDSRNVYADGGKACDCGYSGVRRRATTPDVSAAEHNICMSPFYSSPRSTPRL